MMTKEVQRVKCESCSEKTNNYYPILINRGKIFLCAECYENSIRRSTTTYNNPSNKNKNN